jgi:hypothetical protein
MAEKKAQKDHPADFPQDKGDPDEPLPPPLEDDEVDVEDQPNAVPDPWHDTRGVHGDTGNPTEHTVDEDGE